MLLAITIAYIATTSTPGASALPTPDMVMEVLPAAHRGEPDITRATKGDPAAQFELGRDYLVGRFEPRNLKLGEYWIRQSAIQGYLPAELLLGSWYSFKNDVLRLDRIEALKWLLLARETDKTDELKRSIALVSASLSKAELQSAYRRADETRRYRERLKHFQERGDNAIEK